MRVFSLEDSSCDSNDNYFENSRRESLCRLENKLEEIYSKYSSGVLPDDQTDIIDISSLEIIQSSGFLASLPDAPSNLLGYIKSGHKTNSFKREHLRRARPFDIIPNKPQKRRDKLLHELEAAVLAKESIPIEFIYALQFQDDSTHDDLIDDLYASIIFDQPAVNFRYASDDRSLVNTVMSTDDHPEDISYSIDQLLEPICMGY